MKIKREFFQKICGKISDISFTVGVGFKPESKINIKTTTYFLGFKIKHTLKNTTIIDPKMIEAARMFNTKPINNRTVVKGFIK